MKQGISRRRLTSGLCGIPLLVVPATAAPSFSRARSLTAQQRATADGILQREINNGVVPGLGWSIGNPSVTLAEGALGLRTVSPAVPMGAATRCALASVSKQFTAACVFLLRDDGALSLDSPLADYLPEYRHARKMTLRQVLTTCSGMPIDIEICEAPINGRLDGATLVENLNRLELEFTPGEHFAYSNCAYDVAGFVVAKVSGLPFDRFIDDRIFKPLGMTSSYVLGTRSDKDFADGYSAEGNSWKPAPLSAADRAFASGNLASNPGDMQRWNRALLTRNCSPASRCRRSSRCPY